MGLSCSTQDLHCSTRVLSYGMWDLVPWPQIEPRPPALGAWSLSHWMTREVPNLILVLKCLFRGKHKLGQQDKRHCAHFTDGPWSVSVSAHTAEVSSGFCTPCPHPQSKPCQVTATCNVLRTPSGLPKAYSQGLVSPTEESRAQRDLPRFTWLANGENEVSNLGFLMTNSWLIPWQSATP